MLFSVLPDDLSQEEWQGVKHEFYNLHVHTEYSLLDGSNKIKEYVARVKELGMDSAAITDHGVMYGVIDFYREAKKAGINPILGCEVYGRWVPGLTEKFPVERQILSSGTIGGK